MTNAEAAQHFASLPPTRPAWVVVINRDTRTHSFAPLNPVTAEDMDEVDEIDASDRQRAMSLLGISQQR